MKTILIRALAAGAMTLPLLGHAKNVEPVPLMPEADECAQCRMAVEEPRFAAELIASDGQVHKFDDLGCMAAYVRAQGPRMKAPRAMFVGDFHKGRWVPLGQATLRKTKFPTPMRYGYLAFASAAEAAKLDKKYAPQPVTWAELVKAK